MPAWMPWATIVRNCGPTTTFGSVDERWGLPPEGAGWEGSRPLANRTRHHHVVAEELELVPQPFLQLRQRRIALVLQEVHLQPHDRLVLTMERQPGVVHAVLIE